MDKVQPLKEINSLNSNDVDVSKEGISSFSDIQKEKQTGVESSEEDYYFREDFSRERSYFISLDSSNLQPQMYKDIRRAKNNIRGLLYQLYETIELTCRRKQTCEDLQNYRKALYKLWIEWCEKQIKNEDKDDIEFLEHMTLHMSRRIALKLQSAFMDLMPKVQGLPSSLQDDIQLSCSDMQDLHTIFALGNEFEDLDKHRLRKSQLKLTEAQLSVEKLCCFLEE
ncbi:perilipin-3-like [Antechinus flavipes]|uniref:perilipin-3-like n=1 Tax=Antechinus flavipes TaxID=38775 RepID=UPI0022363FCF|nr:perilipin-3-like [Antechinus flavipes]